LANLSGADSQEIVKLAKIEAVVAEAQQIFKKKFSPEMKANWRAYPNNLGHKDSAGCFR